VCARKACLRARAFTLARSLHARGSCCLRKIQFTLAPALRAHTLILKRHQRLNTHHSENHATSPRVFQEPKTLPEYKHFEPYHPFEPLNGKNTRHLEAAYEDEHDAPPPMNHKHKDYNSDYNHGVGTSTKTTTTTTHPRRRTPARKEKKTGRHDAASPEPLDAHDAIETNTKKQKVRNTEDRLRDPDDAPIGVPEIRPRPLNWHLMTANQRRNWRRWAKLTRMGPTTPGGLPPGLGGATPRDTIPHTCALYSQQTPPPPRQRRRKLAQAPTLGATGDFLSSVLPSPQTKEAG